MASGRTGSTQRIAEAGYLDLPNDLSDLGNHLTTVDLGSVDLLFDPGLQKTAGESNAHPGVIHGEETHLRGLLTPGFAQPLTVGLPGTHTNSVSCGGARVTDFSTSISGALFGLLSTSMILARLDEPTQDFYALLQPGTNVAATTSLHGSTERRFRAV